MKETLTKKGSNKNKQKIKKMRGIKKIVKFYKNLYCFANIEDNDTRPIQSCREFRGVDTIKQLLVSTSIIFLSKLILIKFLVIKNDYFI